MLIRNILCTSFSLSWFCNFHLSLLKIKFSQVVLGYSKLWTQMATLFLRRMTSLPIPYLRTFWSTALSPKIESGGYGNSSTGKSRPLFQCRLRWMGKQVRLLATFIPQLMVNSQECKFTIQYRVFNLIIWFWMCFSERLVCLVDIAPVERNAMIRIATREVSLKKVNLKSWKIGKIVIHRFHGSLKW